MTASGWTPSTTAPELALSAMVSSSPIFQSRDAAVDDLQRGQHEVHRGERLVRTSTPGPRRGVEDEGDLRLDARLEEPVGRIDVVLEEDEVVGEVAEVGLVGPERSSLRW